MDKFERNITFPHEQKPTHRLIRSFSTFGISEAINPEAVSKRLDEVEGRGFQHDAVQKALDDLDRKALAGSSAAALFRGAFNDLIDQINELEAKQGGEQ